jgi:hypothetical protein
VGAFLLLPCGTRIRALFQRDLPPAASTSAAERQPYPFGVVLRTPSISGVSANTEPVHIPGAGLRAHDCGGTGRTIPPTVALALLVIMQSHRDYSTDTETDNGDLVDAVVAA